MRQRLRNWLVVGILGAVLVALTGFRAQEPGASGTQVVLLGTGTPRALWLEYRARHHTSTRQLADIANQTNPGLLVLYHIAQGGRNGLIPDEQFLDEIRQTYKGKVVMGQDLGRY